MIFRVPGTVEGRVEDVPECRFGAAKPDIRGFGGWPPNTDSIFGDSRASQMFTVNLLFWFNWSNKLNFEIIFCFKIDILTTNFSTKILYRYIGL
jgi:hypothetical protein